MFADPSIANDVSDAIAASVQSIRDPYQVRSSALGPSKIITYLQCPLQYKLRYLDRVTCPVRAEAALGSAIHSVIKFGHQWQWQADRADSSAEMLEAIFEGVEPEGRDEPTVLVSYRQARDVWLPWYWWWQGSQKTVLVEEKWAAAVDPEDCAGLEAPVELEGTIDRVYLEGERFVVSDVKSGARAPGASSLANHLQLSLYAWAFDRACVREDSALELVHLRGQTTCRTRRTPEYLQAVIRDTVVPVARAIQAGIFPAHPGSLYGCQYCVCRAHCVVGAGGEH